MPIPHTGPINMRHASYGIADEFGGSKPDAISEYYRGKAYVPDSPLNAKIATAGAQKWSNYRGSQKAVPCVPPVTWQMQYGRNPIIHVHVPERTAFSIDLKTLLMEGTPPLTYTFVYKNSYDFSRLRLSMTAAGVVRATSPSSVQGGNSVTVRYKITNACGDTGEISCTIEIDNRLTGGIYIEGATSGNYQQPVQPSGGGTAPSGAASPTDYAYNAGTAYMDTSGLMTIHRSSAGGFGIDSIQLSTGNMATIQYHGQQAIIGKRITVRLLFRGGTTTSGTIGARTITLSFSPVASGRTSVPFRPPSGWSIATYGSSGADHNAVGVTVS